MIPLFCSWMLKQKKTTPRPNGWPPGVIMFIRHSKPSLLRPIQGIGVRVSSHGKWLPSTLKYASSGRRIAESEWRKDLGGWRICSGRKCGEQKGTTYTLHMEIHDGSINWFYVVQRFDGKPSTWQKYTLMIQSLRQDINCTVGLNLNSFAQLGGVSSSDGAQKWDGPQVWFILTRSGKFIVNISKS